MESRHVSIWIAAAPDAVYEFASDPRQMSRWAAGLARGGLRQSAEGWIADSPMGQVVVEFAPANAFGVMDHVVHVPGGEAVYNAFRTIPGDTGQADCEVVFTVRQRPGMSDEEFEADVAAIRADLETLRDVLTASE